MVSLNQGRYTYRHDNVLSYIQKCLDSSKYTCYVDIDGHQTQGGGTIPPEVTVTTLKPDIVVIDKTRKTLNIFELTVPGEARINTAHKLKLEKYEHFITDIQIYSVCINPFEIGSHTGYISRDNKTSISKLHKYCKKDINLKQFRKNISAITVLGSYYIFNNRNTETWHTPSEYIAAPMLNM